MRGTQAQRLTGSQGNGVIRGWEPVRLCAYTPMSL